MMHHCRVFSSGTALDSVARRKMVLEAPCLFRDQASRWWLTDEGSEAPRVRPFDLRDLLRFGMMRWNATSIDELEGALSWDRYFGASG